MTQIYTTPATIQTDTDSNKNPAFEGKLLSRLFEQILNVDKNDTVEDLSLLIDRMINKSLRAVLDSILSRGKTSQAKELQTFGEIINILMNKFQVDENNEKLMIWLIGHISAQLDILALFDDDLEMGTDTQLISVVKAYKHAFDILNILFNQPQLSQGELALELGLSPQALSNALGRMKEHQLVFADKHGKKKYYTLSENGKKVHKHLKLQDCSMTPDRLTVYVEEMLITFEKILQGEISSDDAVANVFRPFTQQYTTKPRKLERLMVEIINSVSCTRESRSFASFNFFQIEGKSYGSVENTKWSFSYPIETEGDTNGMSNYCNSTDEISGVKLRHPKKTLAKHKKATDEHMLTKQNRGDIYSDIIIKRAQSGLITPLQKQKKMLGNINTLYYRDTVESRNLTL